MLNVVGNGGPLLSFISQGEPLAVWSLYRLPSVDDDDASSELQRVAALEDAGHPKKGALSRWASRGFGQLGSAGWERQGEWSFLKQTMGASHFSGIG